MTAYRSPHKSPGTKERLVTVRTYVEPLEAQLARAKLDANDIYAVVVEPTGYNPMLTVAAGGVQLKVREPNRAPTR